MKDPEIVVMVYPHINDIINLSRTFIPGNQSEKCGWDDYV